MKKYQSFILDLGNEIKKRNKSTTIKNSLLSVIVLIFFIINIAGCGVSDSGKVTANDVLKQNSEADILMYEGRIYSNMTEVEWFEQRNIEYIKQNLIGEIEKQSTHSFGFNDMTATKLPIGTKVFSSREVNKAKDSGILIIEFEGEYLYYLVLLEG